jgi:opacity protein-like surface antigen
MRTVRNLALAAVGALALASAALAQDAQKPEAKPEAKAESGGCHGASHGARHGKHERHGKQEKHDHS